MDNTLSRYRSIFIYLVLALVPLVVFWQVRTHDFIVYDDSEYVTHNPHTQAGLTCDSIKWAFTSGHASNWHPLTWLSHMLDCQFFGLNAGRHHMTSLLLHIANTLLLFWALKNMTGGLWRSFFVAGAFALHPLHVESVAWVAERKDVLSGLFWMLTMAGYVRYVRNRSIKLYLVTLVVFTLGLMSKPMLVTLPLVLLLLDYWPLGRFQKDRAVIYRLVWEKIPFFVLSAVSSVTTFLVQLSTGAVSKSGLISLNMRVANAVVSYLMYALKMFWPRRLVVFYPHPVNTVATWQLIVSVVFVLGISVLAVWLARNHRYFLVGWLWYLGTLVPVIGLVQVGTQAMADRYSYIPLTGLFIIIAWGLPEVLTKLRYRKVILGTSTIVVLVVLSVCTWHQLGYWSDSITLFEHALEVTGGNSVVHNNLGIALSGQGKFDEAISNYRKTLELEPKDIKARNNIGLVLAAQGKFEEAISHYRKALEVKPDTPEVHYNLASALSELNKYEEAIGHYRKTLQARPDSVEVHNNLANIFQMQGRYDEAIGHYRRILQIDSGNAEVYYNLALVLQSQGKLEQAIGYYRRSLEIKPDFAAAHNNLGNALLSQGKFDEAIRSFRSAAELKPDWPLPLNAAAWILATHPDESLRDAGRAIRLAERAVELTNHQNATFLNTLAAAYAAAGRFEKAETTAKTALELALSAENDELAEVIRKKLELYRQRSP